MEKEYMLSIRATQLKRKEELKKMGAYMQWVCPICGFYYVADTEERKYVHVYLHLDRFHPELMNGLVRLDQVRNYSLSDSWNK